MSTHSILINPLNKTSPLPLKGKVLFCDSCFLINAAKPATLENVIKTKLQNMGCGLAYNITVKSEVMHVMRYELVEHAVINKTIKSNAAINSLWKSKFSRNEKMKEMALKHYNFLKQAIGPQGNILQNEVENNVLGGCVYFGQANGAKASWQDVYEIMGQTGLDSSDAMIFNIAIHNLTFDGIITSDKDYKNCTRYASTPRNFSIYTC